MTSEPTPSRYATKQYPSDAYSIPPPGLSIVASAAEDGGKSIPAKAANRRHAGVGNLISPEVLRTVRTTQLDTTAWLDCRSRVTARAHPREEVSTITKGQVKMTTLWLGLATATVVLLQALIQLAQMFMHH